jgi:hypothetical protein
MSVYGAAKVPGVARPPLSKLLNGRADLSGDMALRYRSSGTADAQVWTEAAGRSGRVSPHGDAVGSRQDCSSSKCAREKPRPLRR